MKPVKPKIVSKDNSSPSAKEQIKLTKYGKVELTPLAEKLMVFAKEDKSVLLYGDYAGDLSVFISEFHNVLHDTEPFFEYVGKKKMPMSFSPSEYLTREMVKAISDRDHERIYELLRDFECTNNTHLEFDCNPNDGKTVFEVLTRVNHFTQEEFIDKMSFVTKKFRKHEIYLYWESICTDIMANKDNFCEAFSNTTRYCSQPLLERKGTLFVNNLTCNGTEDKRWFKALGKEIKKCKYSEGEWHVFYTKRDGWLVVAIDDLDDFPPKFVDQFELVPLDDSEARQQNKEINKEDVAVAPPKAVTGRRPVNIDGIKKKRGSKPKNPKHGEFVGILDDILEYGEDISLSKYVKKVQTEMGKRGLKKKTKNTGQEEGFIYTDKTIKTYIQKHPNYKKIQKRRENHKKA